jgi:hypothetical protein
MPEKPREEKDKLPECEKSPAPIKPETGDEDSSAQAQREKSYYYDDSHGYEIYNPEEDEDDDEDTGFPVIEIKKDKNDAH